MTPIGSSRAARAPFRRILVPLDLTARSRKSVDVAVALAAPGSARLTLLHVIETIPGLEFRELAPFYRTLAQKARTSMTALARHATKNHVDVTQEIVYGSRAEAIVDFAAAHRTDLIVLASHRIGRSGGHRDWGTISYKVGILARCAVLLVK